MNYKIFFVFIFIYLSGCEDNNPIESENNLFVLEYHNYFGVFQWNGVHIGTKIIITENDSIKYFNLYSNGIGQDELKVSEDKLQVTKRDSILSIFLQYKFYDYPSVLPEKDSINIPARTIIIKFKRKEDSEFKIVDAILNQGSQFYPENFQNFIDNLDEVLGLK